MMSQADLLKLIPESSQYDWIEDLTPSVWLQHVGTFGQAIAYADLFWPEFIEHDGCILRKDRFNEENYKEWMKSTGGDRAAVEAVINHIHLSNLFPHSDHNPTHAQLVQLGGMLKDFWTAKLERDYPKRCYVSFYQHTPHAEGFEITVMQPHHPRPSKHNHSN